MPTISAGQSIDLVTHYSNYVCFIFGNEESQLHPDLIIFIKFGELISMAVVATIIPGLQRIAMTELFKHGRVSLMNAFPILRKDYLL